MTSRKTSVPNLNVEAEVTPLFVVPFLIVLNEDALTDESDVVESSETDIVLISTQNKS